MEYDKPYKSFDELLEILKNKHGLTPPIPPYARDILICTPYYDLVNGYKSHFMKGDQFLPDVTFNKLYLFHVLDRGFQNVLFEASIIIEDYFKNVLAHILAKNFGVDTSEYLAPEHFLEFHGKGRQKISRNYILKNLQEQYEYPRDDPTKFYKKHHNHIPPWIFLKNVSFSDSINMFTLLQRREKQEILNIMFPGSIAYQDAVPILRYILTMVRHCRNAIAHGLKFIDFNAARYGKNLNKKALRILIPYSLLTNDELFHGDLYYTVYGYIIFSLVLIRTPLEKVIITQKIIQNAPPPMHSDTEEPDSFLNLVNEYFDALHIPSDFCNRLINYVAEVTGFPSPVESR